jgi:hypothetical protein
VLSPALFFSVAAMSDSVHSRPRSKMHGHRFNIGLLVVAGVFMFMRIFMENEKMAGVKQSLTTAQPFFAQTTPSGPYSYFRQAYDTVYDAVIQETSCTTTLATDCFPRKRVNFTTFSLKAMGGLLDVDREFVEEIYYHANSVFEFGIGESTDIAAATNLPRYLGVDSSSEWVKNVRDRAPDRFRFFFADVGKTGEWGYPVNDKGQKRKTTSKMMLDYQIAPLFLEKKPFDVYMVDGRWRVACVMVCFLHATQTGGDLKKIRVILHDYSNREGMYDVVEDVAKIEQQVGRGVLLSLRPYVKEADLFDMWKRFMNVSS